MPVVNQFSTSSTKKRSTKLIQAQRSSSMRCATFLQVLLASLLVIIILVSRPTLPASQAEERTAPAPLILLVRHAEKASAPANDPLLTPAGTKRAHALAEALREADVKAIITTEARRTRDTAQPLATKLGLDPEVIQPEAGEELSAHAEKVATAVRLHEGETVLVVGHSNTVPAIIAALGGPHLANICESLYASLFVLVPGAKARLVQTRYGAADPEPGPGC
jgi:phosphohistidine phosphatase SixA